jgi:SH3-like domain-containing protein
LKVEIRDEYDRWLKIRLPDGKLGWVSAGTVERI